MHTWREAQNSMKLSAVDHLVDRIVVRYKKAVILEIPQNTTKKVIAARNLKRSEPSFPLKQGKRKKKIKFF